MKETNERLVKIKAVDWGYYDGKDVHEIDDGGFKPYIGWLHGQVIEETDDYIAVGLETFETRMCRRVISIPKSAIKEIIEFKRKGLSYPPPEKGKRVDDNTNDGG